MMKSNGEPAGKVRAGMAAARADPVPMSAHRVPGCPLGANVLSLPLKLHHAIKESENERG